MNLGPMMNVIPIQLSLLEFGRTNSTRNLVLTAELLRLFNLFDQAEIPAISFKGPVLTQLLYGDFSLREFSDLDIVVREADVSKAEDILSVFEIGVRFVSSETYDIQCGQESRIFSR